MRPIETDRPSGILYRRWEAGRLSQASLLLVHGLGAHSARWRFLAEFFLRERISSYAIELKGFGETKDSRGHIDSFNTYFDDITALYNIMRKEDASKKVFLVGESMGGLISFLLAARKPALFDGLICISPAFANRLRFTPLDYVRIFLPLFYNPEKKIEMPFISEMCTRDVEYQKAMDADDRECRIASSRILLNIAAAQARAAFLKNKVKTPLLFLLSGVDVIVDEKAAKKAFEGLRTEDKTIIEYPDMRHALSIDLGKEKVFEDMLKWILKRI